MTNRYGIPALFIGLLLLNTESSAQCSDAGVCSIGGADEPGHILVFSAAVSHGASKDDELSFTDVHMGLRALIHEDVSMSASIPYRSMSGPLGSTSGIGDLLMAARYTIWTDGEMSASIEGGFRFATGSVNEKLLPQAYQPGLGTTDALLGISMVGDRWSASVGYQYAPGRSANSVNRLRRGDDLSLRGIYIVHDDKLVIRGEAILIHKLKASDGSYPAPPLSSLAFLSGSIPETDRTQINLVGDVSYPLQQDIMLNVRGAMALLSRPVNIDGLKRNFTIQAGISLPFL